MNVLELTKEQISELKQAFYCNENKNVSYDELANIDELITDETIFTEYGAISFVDDDFFTFRA